MSSEDVRRRSSQPGEHLQRDLCTSRRGGAPSAGVPPDAPAHAVYPPCRRTGKTTTRAPVAGLALDDMRTLTRLNTVAILAVAATLAVTANPVEAAPRVGPLVGIGEQQPAMFASTPWKRLQVRDARYLAPWDAL